MGGLKSRCICLVTGVALLLSAIGCKKLVEVDPPLIYTSGSNAYSSDASAISVVNGVYATMSNSTFETFNGFMSFFTGLSSDEFLLSSAVSDVNYIQYYRNSLNSNSGTNIWINEYPVINRLNVALQGLDASTSITPAVKTQLIGEVKFLRAWHYFYLVNLYGDVPLVLSTDYKTNSLLPRSPVDAVYRQVIADLTDAQNLLSDHFVGSNGYSVSEERVVPNKWAAKAMLARAYLYTKDHAKANAAATEVINNSTLFELSPLDKVFLKNSREAIWQIQPVIPSWNTPDAQRFIIPAAGPDNDYPVSLSASLRASFETGDRRWTNWVGSVTVGTDTYYFPYKYKSATYDDPVTEYQMILRLAEQYLIRAEANAQQGNTAAALADLNTIRTRAGLADYAGATDRASLIAAILKERRIEFFSEMGHRWLDLKRSGTVDQVMGAEAAVKNGRWRKEDQFYPLHVSELVNGPNLTQTPGY